jgi:hypothetical protein
LRKRFSESDQIGSGRYSLTPAARTALDAHLANGGNAAT